MVRSAKTVKRTRKNSKLIMLERQELVSRHYLEGKPQHEIAKLVNVSQMTVSNDLLAIRERHVANAERDYKTRLGEELAKLDKVEAAAWRSYERSCEDAVTMTIEKVPVSVKPKKGEDAKPSKKIVVTKSIEQRKGQAGDASFLSVIDRCVEKRMKLLGFLDDRTIINNTNAVSTDFSQLFARKDDPQLQEKQLPVINVVDDPMEQELKKLEQQAGIDR